MKLHSLLSILAINVPLRISSIRWAGVRIGWGSWIKSRAEIGYGTATGWNFCVRGSGKLMVGRYCAIGENVRIITSNHETECLTLNFHLQSRLIGRRLIAEKADVTIGNDVWIGDGAIILAGVSVGDGAIIGAGAVVTKPVAAFSIAAGNPARIIRKRFRQEVIEELAGLAWWEWSIRELQERKSIFDKRLD